MYYNQMKIQNWYKIIHFMKQKLGNFKKKLGN